MGALAVAPDLRCVASHALRREGQGERVRLPNRQRPHSTRRGPDLDQLRAANEALGGAAEAFFEGLLRGHPRSAAYHAKKILGLRERYQIADLLGALAHALSYQAFQQDAIQRILVVRAQSRRLDEYIGEATARRLAAKVGPDETEPRALEEYDDLPCVGDVPDIELPETT